MDKPSSQYQISETDLILNADGSVYHLALRPGELAETIVLVGDPERIDKLMPIFDEVELERQKREFRTVTGLVSGRRISMVATGIGTDNIDIVLNEIDALFNIDLRTRQILPKHTALQFIRLGTSGALQAEAKVHDLIYSRMAIGFDVLGQYYPYSQTEQSKQLEVALQAHLQTHLSAPPPPFYVVDNRHQKHAPAHDHSGITCTMPGFYAPQGRSLRYTARYPKLLDVLTNFEWNGERIMNFEMETAGTLMLAQHLGHSYHSMSIILANRNLRQFGSLTSNESLGRLKLLLDI